MIVEKGHRFFTWQSSIPYNTLVQTSIQISRDVFFLPLFILARASMASVMGCPHPHSAV